MLLQTRNHIIFQTKNSKSLSEHKQSNENILIPFLNYPQIQNIVKALCCGRLRCRGSFTVEAAFVIPFFLMACVVVLGLFPLLLVQVQVSNALQYAARMTAVSYRDVQDAHDVLSLAEGEILFFTYLNAHGCDEEAISGGKAGISFLTSDLSGDYVVLDAGYVVELPLRFGNVGNLPVHQSVKARKWTGASDSAEGSGGGTGGTVYITPYGNAYHSSTECSSLALSVHSVSVHGLRQLRNDSGGKYYPCTCYNGSDAVYITNYGAEYHSTLTCSDLKRTVFEVPMEQIGQRHPCAICNGGS